MQRKPNIFDGGLTITDYISRKEAVDAFFPVDPENDGSDGTTPIYLERDYSNNEIESILWEVPSADVEPVRHGNWNIRLADEMTLCLECPICGRKVDNIDLHNLLEAGKYGEPCRRYPYCHCGAKMCLEEDTCEM